MVNLLKKTFSEFSKDRCPQMAAAIAYYAIFSLPAILVTLLLVTGFFVDPAQIQGRIGGEIESVLGKGAAEQLTVMVRAASEGQGKGLAGIIGLFALLFGATGVVTQLQSALNIVWEVSDAARQSGVLGMVFKRLISVGMLLVIAALLLASIVLSAVIGSLGSGIEQLLPAWLSAKALQTINSVAGFLVFTTVFALTFKLLPNAKVRWRDVWLGALVTAVLFLLGKAALSLYVSKGSVGSAYGAAGSLVLIMLWIYYSALIVLFGAEFTQVWAQQSGREIQPAQSQASRDTRQNGAAHDRRAHKNRAHDEEARV